mmetsp:Transcript_118096/g.270934  ORF Transcript_118096/g.270934 Transcript_118096/m.270934 type:complete len:209 (+) Transcript_118096:352-978(+)
MMPRSSDRREETSCISSGDINRDKPSRAVRVCSCSLPTSATLVRRWFDSFRSCATCNTAFWALSLSSLGAASSKWATNKYSTGKGWPSSSFLGGVCTVTVFPPSYAPIFKKRRSISAGSLLCSHSAFMALAWRSQLPAPCLRRLAASSASSHSDHPSSWASVRIGMGAWCRPAGVRACGWWEPQEVPRRQQVGQEKYIGQAAQRIAIG